MAAAMPSGAAYAPPSYLRRHLLSMDAPYPIDSYESLCRGVSGSEFTFDLGNLAAFDPSPLNEEEARTNPDGCCQQLATTMTQALVERLFALPSQPVEGGRIAQLPPPSTPLPRAKPLPKPRAPTKWERFAQRKGIQKQKRSKLVLDEASGEWKRRYGYKHANDPDNVPIMEASSGDQVCTELHCQTHRCPACALHSMSHSSCLIWVASREARTPSRSSRQPSRRASRHRASGNLQTSKHRPRQRGGQGHEAAVAGLLCRCKTMRRADSSRQQRWAGVEESVSTCASSPAVSVPAAACSSALLHACATAVQVLACSCQDLAWLLQRKQASRQAGVSTASMGKYDKRLPDEKPDERAPSSKRRKFAPVTEAGGAEGQRVSALVDNILARRGTGGSTHSSLLLAKSAARAVCRCDGTLACLHAV